MENEAYYTEKAREIYSQIRKMTLEEWIASPHTNKEHPEDMQAMYHRVANEHDESEFVHFVLTGELTGVELGEGELDLVAGGAGVGRRTGVMPTPQANFACMVVPPPSAN